MINAKKMLSILFSSFLLITSASSSYAAESPENIENTPVSYTTNYPTFNKTDKKTGVCVTANSGIYPEDAELLVTELTPGSSEYNKAIAGLDTDRAKNAQKLNIYNIEVIKDGKNIELSNNQVVTVRIPIPYGFDKNEIETLSIIYGDNNDVNIGGSVTEVDGKSYFEFTTNKLNQFKNIVVVDKKSIFMTAFVFIVVAVIVVIILLPSNKKKKASK